MSVLKEREVLDKVSKRGEYRKRQGIQREREKDIHKECKREKKKTKTCIHDIEKYKLCVCE